MPRARRCASTSSPMPLAASDSSASISRREKVAPSAVPCDTDMNVVMTASGGFVELQGTAEGATFSRLEMDALLALAAKGIGELVEAQRRALGIAAA